MSFARLLHPQSIAVIGGREAEEVIRQCIKSGFKGDIWPIHPKKDMVAGKKVYRSVTELPSAPDAAYVAVNRNLTISVVQQLAEIGAGGAVCYATGFSESGKEGQELEQQLLQASGDMPLLGPNCYGLINYCEQAILWPDQHGGETVERGVALITQSSNVAVNLTMQQRGLPVSYVVSLGNKVKFDLPDAIREFAQQQNVTAIGLYIEGISDPVAFESAVRFARELGKPIVAIKTGRSDLAQKIALSHTASLVGSDQLIDALFARNGVGRVSSMEGLVETLKVLHVLGPIPGYKLGAMAPSGGDGALLADNVETGRLQLTSLSADHQDKISKTVHELVTVSNPFDYQVFDWLNTERLTATYRAFIGDEFDVSLCLFDFPRQDRCDDTNWMPAQQALVNAAENNCANVAVLSILPEGLPETTAKYLISKGIAPLAGLAAGIEGLQAAADIGTAWQLPMPELMHQVPAKIDEQQLKLLDEAEAKRRIAEFGVFVPKSDIVNGAVQALAVADTLSYPLVVKALGIAHKTDVGGVKLNLTTADEVSQAVKAMSHLSERFLLEEMVDEVVAEIIIGVVCDEQFGPYLVIGAGGILVELMRDSCSLLLPVNRQEVYDALQSLRSAALFNGFRGRAKADLDAAVDAILAIANFVQEHASSISELDINPLMIRAQGKGAIAADALLRMKD